ncbi:unnamed protein product, partial [Diplocarpon coronariae]
MRKPPSSFSSSSELSAAACISFTIDFLRSS